MKESLNFSLPIHSTEFTFFFKAMKKFDTFGREKSFAKNVFSCFSFHDEVKSCHATYLLQKSEQ